MRRMSSAHSLAVLYWLRSNFRFTFHFDVDDVDNVDIVDGKVR